MCLVDEITFRKKYSLHDVLVRLRKPHDYLLDIISEIRLDWFCAVPLCYKSEIFHNDKDS